MTIVRDAARATLEAGSARVSQRRFVDPPGTLISREVGETDFTRRRTRTTVVREDPYGLMERLETALPWLADDADEGDEAAPSAHLYAGTASWFEFPTGKAVSMGGGDPMARRRGHTDPTWIVEALEHVHREDCRGDDRLGFLVDLAETGAALEIPPHRGRRAPRIAGEVWLDDAGRIRRVTWSAFGRARPRERSDRRGWTTSELWDFGTAVTIDLPEPSHEPPLPLQLVRVASILWRRKRAYERRAGLA
jgi:hypothetical protein